MNRTACVLAVLLGLLLLAWLLLAASSRQEWRPLDRPLLAAGGGCFFTEADDR